MTDEERAVIQAALLLEAYSDDAYRKTLTTSLVVAVRALRDSRKPAPKWTANGAHDIDGPDGTIVVVLARPGMSTTGMCIRDRVLRLLNEDEQR